MRSPGLVLRLCFADLRQEQLPAKQEQLSLLLFVALRIHDVGSFPRALEDDRWFVGFLDVGDDGGVQYPPLREAPISTIRSRTMRRTSSGGMGWSGVNWMVPLLKRYAANSSR